MLTDTVLMSEMENLNRFALKLCKNRADADDLLQATIERALTYKTKFEDGTRAFSWLSRIMFNLFATQYKRRTRYESMYDPEQEIMNQAFNADQDDKVMLTEISSALNKLSAQHKEILILVCAYEYSYEEVAAQLNIPVGTVRSRLSRARESLNSLMSVNDNLSFKPIAASMARVATVH